jgi:hypothetical protein
VDEPHISLLPPPASLWCDEKQERDAVSSAPPGSLRLIAARS